MVSYLKQRGVDPDAEFEHWINVLDAITDGVPPNVKPCTFAWANGPGGNWISSGGYEPIADAVFNRVGVDMYLLEFDNERSGGFEPLRFVPLNKGVVLGLITTKSSILEPIDQLKRRVDQASKFIAYERLAISPQCGFSSDTIDRPLDEHDQLKKLRLVAHAASEIWDD